MRDNDWKTFAVDGAMNGRRIGLKNSENANDLSVTGVIDQTYYANKGTNAQYKAKIGAYTVYFNTSGTILSTVPTNSDWIGKTIKMVDTQIYQTSGTMVKPYTPEGEEEQEPVDLSEMDTRDHFATAIIGVLIGKLKDPANADDGNILFTCRAAYRWANGMMTAAADARLGTLQEYEEAEEMTGNVTVNITIQNASSSAITIMPRIRFILSTEGRTTQYPYNRTEAATLGNSDITIGAGQSVTFSDITIPGNSNQYVGQHFAEQSEFSPNYPSNVLLYDTDGVSSTIVPNMINPATLFQDGGTYTVVYGTAAVSPAPSPDPATEPIS